MSDVAYEAILEAARTRFAEEGYRDVTIRSIAAEAGYSPAMVMKLMGNKERLFALAAPGVTASGLEQHHLIPKEEIGHELVRRIFARYRQGAGDPYALVPFFVRSAPEPEQICDEIRERYERNMAAMIGDSTEDGRHAKTVLSLMYGIAASVHTMHAYETDHDDAIAVYARLAQSIIDLCDGPRVPLPDESVGIKAASCGPVRKD